ncbi:helix-hairpin-helix domain-containing protein [Rhizobium sp. C4]|uniref:helix-hairpin-helix domain-containing protein n=1 Tax=Rhizobium sp. C4 TaxID=1349800 RepID=UPI001E485487|nr:helix-hairpin-helix domain-containing protein [Rhizobium sp. C4]MCD2171516.1 helix-hairpin-helix domain-containing protein [Rhizobium sp. C4]
MNAQRNDHRDDMSAPHDAVANLVRATNEAMEAFMKTDWTKDRDKEEGVALNPLMANPAIMMAAATAYGIRMTGQWASLFLNALQDQADRANAETQEPAVADVAPAAEPVVAKVAEAEPAEPVVTGAPSKARSAKPAVEEVIEKHARKAVKSAKARKSAEKAAVVKTSASAKDDLKRISGIGPKLANVLIGHGVVTFAQLAKMDEAALAALDAELGLEGRILRDDWAGQARTILATGH